MKKYFPVFYLFELDIFSMGSFFFFFLCAFLTVVFSFIGFSYISAFSLLFMALKIIKLSVDYRIKDNDNVNLFCVFIYSGSCLISKDFFLHYCLLGIFAKTEWELIIKLLVYYLASLVCLIPPIEIIQFLYRKDFIRTIIAIGYAMSDAGALNWLTFEFLNGSLSTFHYWVLMTLLILVPGAFFVLKEALSFDIKRTVAVLKEVRNILVINSTLSILIIIMNQIMPLNLNEKKLIGFVLNAVGMTFYFSYKSYLMGLFFEEKTKIMLEKKNK